MDSYDVIIIGAGLAGLTAGIHLSKLGLQVMVVEKHSFPRHKVCGEYISNEVLPYMRWLDADPSQLRPAKISKLIFSTKTGKSFCSDLPQGGFGISRFKLDHFLYEKAISNGCMFSFSTVNEVNFQNDQFKVVTNNEQTFTSKVVLGAFGKRSNIDKSLNRSFVVKKSNWLAVKAHYSLDYPIDTVGLYNFDGGYCGVSNVEDNKVNVCYLTDYSSFSQYKSPQMFQENVMSRNPQLKQIFGNSSLLFERPLTISQISFDRKHPVEDHILMIGDSAGLIHPLCGNGMAMAIHGAKIASELVLRFVNNDVSRFQLEETYTRSWKKQFGNRLSAGRMLASGMQNSALTQTMMAGLKLFPSLLPPIVKLTHGKPINC